MARDRREIGETYTIDDPDNHCFGCSPHNSRGLQLRFTRTGERTVEVRFHADTHLCGAPEVVHGGIQATLLDEAFGAAAHNAYDPDDAQVVTAEFSLRYRRPVPTGKPLTVRSEVVRMEGRDAWVEGAILDGSGEVLTRAEARWRRID